MDPQALKSGLRTSVGIAKVVWKKFHSDRLPC